MTFEPIQISHKYIEYATMSSVAHQQPKQKTTFQVFMIKTIKRS